MKKKRVVITGIGIISSIGNTKQEVLNSLKKGKSGITFSPEFKAYGMRSNVYGNINLDINGIINKKHIRFMSNAAIYSYIAMKQAIEDSGLTYKMISHDRTGLIIGSSGGSPSNQILTINSMLPKGIRKIKPYMIIKTMASNISASLAIAFNIRGINYSISSACATSAHCIGNGFELIQFGKQDIIFAGGGEELSCEMACMFDAMGVLSTNFNNTPQSSSRTYDKNRDGFVISAGSGIVVLEELTHALSRNAYIYSEIIGYGTTSDGIDMVTPSVEGAVRCMNMARLNHKLPVDYLNVHGTSTKKGDLIELCAIKECFKQYIPVISATKSMTGHSLGAAGVHELIFSILMMNNNFIAPSINIDELDPKINNNLTIITKTTFTKLNYIMSNSFGFGGTNVSLTIKKFK